jgi:uncharacterized protein (DUF1330 family)
VGHKPSPTPLSGELHIVVALSRSRHRGLPSSREFKGGVRAVGGHFTFNRSTFSFHVVNCAEQIVVLARIVWGNLNMKMNNKLALAVLAGVAVGVTGATIIHAQVTVPPAYFIAEVDVSESTADQRDAYLQKYAPNVPATIAPFGGRYLVRAGKIQALEGEPPKRVIVMAFDSAEKLRSWYDSPAYAALKPIRQNSTKSRLYSVEGVTPQ